MTPDKTVAKKSPLLPAFACAVALLASLPSPVAAVSLADYPALGRLIDTMVERHGFDRSALERLFTNATLDPQVVGAMEQPREALPWHAYRRGFLTEERIKLGVRYWRDHHETLARAKRMYGVPPEVIVAIIGIESRYGIHQGSHSVFEALLTLTLDFSRRSEFFQNELEEFLLLTRELRIEPGSVKGSYAGALGIPQFIASSYRNYAVDFDGDSQRDLFNNDADAIGSVANFLSRHGWAAGQPIVDPARVRRSPDARPVPRKSEPVLTLREWLDYGVTPKHKPTASALDGKEDDRLAGLIALQGESGPLYHLGYNNFYVITRYNRSHNYAMAIYELARMIRQRYKRDS